MNGLAGRDRELRRRADATRARRPQLGFVGAGALPARQQRPRRQLLPRHPVRQHRQPDERARTATPRPRAGTRPPAGASPTGSTSPPAIALAARRHEPERARLAVASTSRWTCAKTPSNSTERAFSCPSARPATRSAAPRAARPWYGKFLPSGAWGAVNTFFKSTDGGQTWFPSNSDMFSIACTSSEHVHRGRGRRPRTAARPTAAARGRTSRRPRATTSRSPQSPARAARSATRSATAATR